MRKNYLIIVSLVIIAALVSCSDDNGDFNIGLYASGSYGVQLSDTEFKPVVVFTSTFTTISSSQSSLTQNGDRIDGKSFTDHTYEATVTIQINPPTADAVLLRNPGGVYITALSAGKVVGAQDPSIQKEQ